MLKPEVLDLLGGKKMLVQVKRPRSRQASLRAPGARGARLRVAERPAAYGFESVGAAAVSGARASPFKIAALDGLANRLAVPADDLMVTLGITGRTGQRRRQQGVLSADESDRLYRLARIVERAFEVLGSEEGAREWLTRPQAILEGAAPLALLGSEAGVQAVEQQLGRIDFGDLY